MNFLITSDTHFSDRPRDAYRFGLFPWLKQQQNKYNVSATFHLGDITDAKDKHSSALVNQITNGFASLMKPVYVLKGNHDFIDPTDPYFAFLNYMGVQFVTEPYFHGDLRVAFIPHMPNQASFDDACKFIQPGSAVFTHGLFDGALSEAGTVLSGLSGAAVAARRPLLWVSGDVHRPQRCGPLLVYAGSPYHVRFGDQYTPRVLLVKDGKLTDLHYPSPRKLSLVIGDADELSQTDAKPGDQVKVTVQLAREESVEWAKHRQLVLNVCKDMKLEVFGVELQVMTNTQHERVKVKEAQRPDDVLSAFCKAENVASNIKRVGLEILKEA